ncbi:MAG: hypothetical protein HOW73_36005 [Polyangiaceae bacterium]|nr:hypothetical protein [Polyangiaceae bacterium]
MIGGAVVEATDVLRSAFGLDASARRFFVRADDARALRYPTALRWLGRLGPLRIGAAVVDGRILACLDAAPSRSIARSNETSVAGLVLYAHERGDSLVLVGANVLQIGVFDHAGEGAVRAFDEVVTVASVTRCFDEIERATFELGRANRAPTSDERRATS